MIASAAWAILLPFAGAVIAFGMGRAKALAPLGVLVCFVTLGIAISNVGGVLQNGVSRVQIGGWDAPLGIALYIDGLAALMMLMTASVMLLSSVYAWHRIEEAPLFWPLWLFLLGGLNALFLSADLFNLYVILELLSIVGVTLVVIAGGSGAIAASTRYLFAVFFGSMLYLLGVALAYAMHGTLDMHLLRERLAPGPAVGVTLALLTSGLMIKSALFPFHGWLPRAHASAPSPVSAVLSSLVVMASVYLVLRLWGHVFAGHATFAMAQLVGALGAGAIIWGSLQALRESRLKVVLAYSTVAQVGYLFLLVPLVTARAGTVDAPLAFSAWVGAFFQTFSHAFAKAALFLSAGTILHGYGHDRIRDLGGMALRMPGVTLALGIAGVALVGLPPSGTFAAKWLLLSAAVASGQWWWALVIAVGTLMGAAYVVRILRPAFAVPTGLVITRANVPWVPRAVALLLALVALLLAFWSAGVFALLEVGAPFARVVQEG